MARKGDKLLRDAIADARAVRETALANAKAALEEAFTPHLTSMLSARLKNETDYGDDDQDLEELNDPVSGDGHGSEDGGETDVDAVEKSSHTGNQNVTEDVTDHVESDGAKLDSSGIATEPTQKYGTSNPKDPASGQEESSDIDNEGLQQPVGHKVSEGIFEDEDEDELGLDGDEFGDDQFGGDQFGGGEISAGAGEMGDPAMEPQGMDMGMGGGNEYGDEEEGERDMDLEAIIRELEADIEGDEYGDEEYPMEGEMDMGYPDEDEEDPMMEANDNTPPAADGHGADEGGETDKSANVDSTFTQGSGDSQTDPITEGEYEDEEEIDLDEILREIADEEAEDDVKVEVASLKSELKEYRDAIRYLRSKLNEVNLLNAKLLFTNKLFKNYNMDMNQKLRVVENFDRAVTVREAKLVFTALAETFRGRPVRKRIIEGLASKRVGSTKPKQKIKTRPAFGSQTVLAEGADLAARFQKLAGITKD